MTCDEPRKVGTLRLESKLLHDAMEILESIDADADTAVTLETTLEAQCPVDTSLTNEYDLTVSYRPSHGAVIETGSFAEFVAMFEGEAASQEALTTFIHRVLYTQFLVEWLEVRMEGFHDEIAVTTKKTRERGEP